MQRLATMEEYKASVQGVDDALARLNATLASYKLLDRHTDAPAAPKKDKAKGHVSQGRQASQPVHERTTIGYRTFLVASKVSKVPLEWESWRSRSLEETKQYAQVRDVDQLGREHIELILVY